MAYTVKNQVERVTRGALAIDKRMDDFIARALVGTGQDVDTYWRNFEHLIDLIIRIF